MDRRTLLKAALLATSGVLLESCSGLSTRQPRPAGNENSSGKPEVRPTVKLPGGDVGFPSPFAYVLGPGYALMTLIYDSLLIAKRPGQFAPWLAQDYRRSSDGMVYTFDLRPQVQWHDGKPLTAADVVFSFDYHAEQNAQGRLSPRLIYQPEYVQRVVALGERSFEIHLEKPAATFLERAAAGFPVIPRHIWESIDDASKAQDQKMLVGSGPYVLSAHGDPPGSYLFESNERFFLGKPLVKRVELIPVGDPVNALVAGDIDAASPGPNASADDIARRFRRDRDFGIIEQPPGAGVVALYFNLAKEGALADPIFRRACARAIDRKGMVRRLLDGKGEPGNPGFLPPRHPYYVRSEQYPYSPAAARKMLQGGGYEMGPEGVRITPDGRPLRFKLMATPFNASTIELLVQQLRAVGIGIELDPVENFGPYVAIAEGNFEMMVIFYGGQDGDPDLMRSVYSSKAERLPFSAAGYSNPEFDRLAEEQQVTLDKEHRKTLVAEMQRIVARDLPFLHLFYPGSIFIYRRTTFDGWSQEANYKLSFTRGRRP